MLKHLLSKGESEGSHVQPALLYSGYVVAFAEVNYKSILLQAFHNL